MINDEDLTDSEDDLFYGGGGGGGDSDSAADTAAGQDHPDPPVAPSADVTRSADGFVGFTGGGSVDAPASARDPAPSADAAHDFEAMENVIVAL